MKAFKTILKSLSWTLSHPRYPQRLICWNRKKQPSGSFKDPDKLFHGFSKPDLDENYKLRLETIRFPDFSCNWDRFSIMSDVRLRSKGNLSDGCFSINVSQYRFQNTATPVHEPICFDKDKGQPPNFSHVEVRLLKDGEAIHLEPPKNRKLDSKTEKKRRLEYRHFILQSIKVELDAYFG